MEAFDPHYRKAARHEFAECGGLEACPPVVLGAGFLSKIKRTLRLFEGPAPNCVSADHGRPDVAVAQQLLDGTDVIVGLQQMGGKTVAKGMGGGTLGNSGLAHRFLYPLLHVRSMQMISPVFSGLVLIGPLFGREKPLPDELSCRVLVFLFQRVHQEHSGISPSKVPPMKVFQ